VDDLSVSADERQPDQEVSDGPAQESLRAAAGGADRAPDGGSGHGLVDGEVLPSLADQAVQIREPDAGLGDDDEVAGGVLDDPVEAADRR